MTSVKDFGAFVEILPGKDGLCHISELADEYVSSVGDVCRVGDAMKVKVIAVDEQDRVKLSRKAAMREMAADGRRRTARRRIVDEETGRGGDAEIRDAFESPVSASPRLRLSSMSAMANPQSSRGTADDDSAATVQRLMDQYTEIARLAGGLAHEIKNPLSTIRLNMELLAEDLDEAETPARRRALKRVEVVRRECQRLQSLLDDFLNFAKVRRLHLEPTDLNHQIDDVLEFFAPEADDGGRRDRALSRSGVAARDARPRGVSPGAVEPDHQRQAGDARRRAAGRPHGGAGRHGGAVPDRHRLRHGRAHGVARCSRRSSPRSPAARAWACRRRRRSSTPTAAASACRAKSAAARRFTIELPVPARLAGVGRVVRHESTNVLRHMHFTHTHPTHPSHHPNICDNEIR